MLGDFVKESLENGEWTILPEFGVAYVDVKRVDLAAFKWKNNKEIQTIAIECKCEGSARESFFAALGQSVQYQLFFPRVFIVTQDGEFFPDQESILERLGLGYMMINEKGELKGIVEPSMDKNCLLDKGFFVSQVRNRAVVLLVFNEMFPEAYNKRFFGGTRQGELWIHNKPKGKVQYRAWTKIGRASYFGINIEAVSLIRNIVKNIDVDQLYQIVSKLPAEYLVELYERATRRGRHEYPILNRQNGSIPIRRSIFGEEGFPACNLTREQIYKEIIERSKKLGYYTHLLIDKKLWDINKNFTRDQYLSEMTKAKKTLDEVYNVLTDWSSK